jgi:endonuclease G
VLQNLTSIGGHTADFRSRDKGRHKDRHRQNDSYVPSNGVEHRADLQLKQAFRNHQSRQAQQSREANFEELSSDFPGREGYDPNFLGKPLALPTIDPSVRGQVAELIGHPGETELKYGNFSIVMNGVRRQPFFTAVMIDGAKVVDVPRDGDWTIDSRIRRDQQLGNEAYKGNNIDKGHQVRRRDAGWGPKAHQSANDTFCYTNAGLQHAALNQKEWLQLENHVLDQLKSKDMKGVVLTGPVLKDSDPEWDNKGRMDKPTQMPQEFWKMVVWNDPQEGLKGSAFVLSQTDFVNPGGLFQSDFEEGRFGVYQVPIAQLEKMTRLDFADVVDAKKEPKQILDAQDAKVLS